MRKSKETYQNQIHNLENILAIYASDMRLMVQFLKDNDMYDKYKEFEAEAMRKEVAERLAKKKQ